MGKIAEYPQLIEFAGDELFIVETNEGTKHYTYSQLEAWVRERHDSYIADNINETIRNLIDSGEVTVKVSEGDSDHVAQLVSNQELFKEALVEALADETLKKMILEGLNVSAEDLADASVSTDKILDAAITTAKLIDSAITAAKIANGAVTGEKLADGSVTKEKLADDVIKFFDHLDKDSTQQSQLITALSSNLKLLTANADNYANGITFGEDGKLYLTHNGNVVSAGVAVATGSAGMAFNSGYQDEAGYIHLTQDGEDVESFTPFMVSGGGGGGGAVGSKLVFAMYSASAFSVLETTGVANVRFCFSSTDAETGTPTGAGQLAIYIGGILKESRMVEQGDDITMDLASFLSTGSNTVKLVMTDSYGASATRTVTITVESFLLEWNLGETEKNTGDLIVYVTPTGSGSKILHLLVDGTEFDTRTVTTSGRRIDFTVPLSVGAHEISVYGEMTLSGVTLTSETLSAVIAEVSEASSNTVIAAKVAESEYDQYSTILIPYRVINAQENPVNASFYANDVLIRTESVDQSEHTWSYRATNPGNLKLAIKSGNSTWTKRVVINDLSAEISEVTDNLALKIDPNQITDLDAFNYNGVTFTVSENFDSHNGGLQTDDEGIRCIKVMKGDRLTINYNLFGADARINGRDMKFIYKVEHASDFDGAAISCKSGKIGLTISANAAAVTTEQSSIELPTCEGYKTELELNIEPDSENKLMMFWEQGTPSRAAIYATNDNFKQTKPVGITVGSDTCDVYLYLVRVYTRDLTKEEIKANFAADGASALEITQRHDRNQVYDSAGNLDPDKVATLNPNLHVLTWHAAGISEAKSQKITGTLTHKYVSGGAAHYWTAENVVQKAQGTSSLGYVDAGCNEDFELKDGIILEDGTKQSMYSMTDNSIGVNYFNFKTNVASQEHINNILLSDWYNTYQPYKRPARQANSKVRDTVEGHMAVLFYHNTGDAPVKVGGAMVQPDETVLYALGCMNNSKKNSEVFKYDNIVIEVGNNISAQCRFKSDDLSTEDFSGDVNFEYRYLNEGIYTEESAKAIFQEFLSWMVSCDADSAPNTAFGTAKVINGQTFTVDSADYRKAKFKAEAEDHMIIDSFLYHQLFTLVFSQVDNRAKNVFLGYDGSRWHVCFAYDNDTAMGNDNEGGLTLKYGYMDTDSVGSKNVFNAADSSIWAMLRYCYADELQAMYVDRENAGAWNLDTFAALCDKNQDYACESLWIDDVWRKDINTFINVGTSAYIPMLNGKKRLQRRNFLHYQRPFISSYFLAPFALSDSATVRGYTPTSWNGVKPESKMTITPYSDLWVTVRAGSTNVQKRAKAGEAVELSLGSSAMNDTEIYVRCASFIADLGDLACLYPGYIDISACGRLQKAVIGSSKEGYSNTNMTSATFKNAASLEYVNVENCPNLAQELDLSNNINVKEVYTRGSGVTGVTFARFGRLKTAMLNAVTSIYAADLNAVETFTLEDYSALTTLNIVGSAIDTLALVMAAANIVRVRLKDIAWSTTVKAYKALIKLGKADGIDDDGHNIEKPVVTGSVYFDAIGTTKYKELQEALPDVSFTYGTTLEEHTVTFCNEDGTVLLTRKVEHNGTVDDPIVDGTIGVPTKAPDTEYVYTYYKWDASLENVAADITVTATYTRANRSNTVKFVMDGTVLETYVVPAHGSCYYHGEDLTKSGHIWTGWDQNTSDVIEDMVVNAVFIYPALPATVKDMTKYDYAYSDDSEDNAAYTFAEFYSIQKMGLTAEYLPIGSKCKFVPVWELTADTSIIFVLHSVGHYELAEGGMSHADWFMKGVLVENRQMNTTNTNVGGWNSCAMRTWLNESFYKAMAPNWRNLIAPAITLASAGNRTSTIVKSTDYLRIPSHAEVGFDVKAVPYVNEISADANEVTFSLFTDNNSRIKKTFNGDGTTQSWWLRSAEPGGAVAFRLVTNSGGATYTNASARYGVCVGFSV